MAKKGNRYKRIIENIFFRHYSDGITEFVFLRKELEDCAHDLGFDPIKNIGDVFYYFRYREELPQRILETQYDDREWVIAGAGDGKYRFKLFKGTRISPKEDISVINLPDATPELIHAYALNDEQSLLAIVRYNRLIDIFLDLTCYSLQSHLRTRVREMGQIEIDEIYI